MPERLSARDVVSVQGEVPRRGAITAIVKRGNEVLVLTCGHVAIPARAKEPMLASKKPMLASRFPGEASEVSVLSVCERTAPGGGASLVLKDAELTGSRDIAIASIGGGHAAFDFSHPAMETKGPFEVRSEDCPTDSKVFQWSPTRDALIGGRVASPARASVSLVLPDGRAQAYERLIAVRSVGPAFSAPGDSGSLVIDEDYRAVGVLIGLSTDEFTAYVLPISRLQDWPDAGAFFRSFS